MDTVRRPLGALLRTWRNRRRLSQLDLALEAGMSARHLSFIETGRARPSREMLLRLADCLQIPPRPCNDVLLAAGYAPRFAERPLTDPDMQSLGASVQLLLDAHDPYPALAVDGKWNLVFANKAVAPLLAGVSPKLLSPPVNVLRLSLHPEGMAPHIENLSEWRANVLLRLAFLSTTMVFDYPLDINVSELLIEVFLPADAATAAALAQTAAGR
ncbi:helix-turn-helix domain-containing protein [Alcaligenaceae bacterium]|nr:helix-turn-helix domain-containing protein [Alcaligenaceae bacterium]